MNTLMSNADMRSKPADKTIIDRLLKPSGTRYRKKTFLRIFSYSLIVCIVVILLAVTALYFSFSGIVTEEIHHKSIDLLSQTRLVFNSLHAWIIPSFRQIRSENSIQSLIMSGSLDDFQISLALDELDEVMSAYYLLHSIYIYNDQSESYFSTINGKEEGVCSDITLPAIVHNIRDFGVYRYIPRKIIYKVNNSVFNSVRDEVKTENVFSVIIGDMPANGKTINGALVVNISEKKIREYFLGINSSSSEDLLIVDEYGKVLTHPDEEEFGKNYSAYPYIKQILESKEAEGVFTTRINDAKYLVSYVTHSGPDWRFINIMPYQMIFANLNSVLKTAVLVFVVLLFLAFMLSYVGSLRVYSPIKRLFSYSYSLKDKQLLHSDSENAKNLSELQAFDRLFKQIVKKVQDSDNNLEDYRELSKSELLRNLLLGEMNAADVQKHTDLVNTVLDKGPYMLAVIRVDNFQTLQETLSSEEISKLFSILKQLIYHSIAFPHFFLHMRNETACVVCNLRGIEEAKRNNDEYLCSVFKNLQHGIKERIGRTISIGLGEPFTKPDEFPVQYKTVFRSSRYSFSFGQDSVISVQDIKENERARYLLPEEKINKLFSDLKFGKHQDPDNLLGEIMNSVKACKYEDYNYLKHFLLYRVRKLIEDMKERLVDSYIKLNELMDVVEGLETPEQTTKAFSEIFICISESLQDKQSGKTRELAEKVKTYIDENFLDKNLCSETIADQLGFSTQYIRFTFKNINNISIIEYINSLRIYYCKKQLQESRLPLKRICQNAGYSNYSYFFTLFKKATGLTPNQFRLRSK